MIYQTQRVKPPILYQYHTILSRWHEFAVPPGSVYTVSFASRLPTIGRFFPPHYSPKEVITALSWFCLTDLNRITAVYVPKSSKVSLLDVPGQPMFSFSYELVTFDQSWPVQADDTEDSSLNQQIGLEFEILDPKNCLVSKVKDGPLWRHEYAKVGQCHRSPVVFFGQIRSILHIFFNHTIK